MRSPSLVAIALFTVIALPAAGKVEPAEIAQRLGEVPVDHPRLYLSAGGESALRRQISADSVMAAGFANVLREADRQLATKPVERVLIGRRLLDKSRTALSRVLHLGLAWWLTGEPKYFERARAELVAVAQFADWNPKHFLDVAEMTTAVGFGYDWLFSNCDEATRTLLREAIVEKGLKPSLKADSWTRATNNWNQVCNGGIAVGALAVAESERALAAQLIARAINTVPVAMHEFAPDGAYPEGPGYWGYGTTFNVILISALQSVLGSDFGLGREPGFLATADYYLHVHGPSGLYFNYSDCGRGGQGVSPAMFWFAAQRKEPYLLWNELPKLLDAGRVGVKTRGDRLDPMLLLWATPGLTRAPQPAALSWTGRGTTPVAFHRSAWTHDASFVAIKAGTPAANHAHMDIGAFVMDADGVRWADDLGMQDYNSLESKGITLWSKAQDAERWKVFRLGTSAHNVLMIDGQQQRVDGNAPIVLSKPGRTVVDTSSVYQGQLASARRGVSLQSDRSVRVQDEIATLGRAASVRWAMVTSADVRIGGPGRATLRLEAKQLGLRVLEPAGVTLKIYSTNPPPSPTDAPNEGMRMIGFETSAPANHAQRIVVQLTPASPPGGDDPVLPLAQW
jgi:hypothetical protein